MERWEQEKGGGATSLGRSGGGEGSFGAPWRSKDRGEAGSAGLPGLPGAVSEGRDRGVVEFEVRQGRQDRRAVCSGSYVESLV